MAVSKKKKVAPKAKPVSKAKAKSKPVSKVKVAAKAKAKPKAAAPKVKAKKSAPPPPPAKKSSQGPAPKKPHFSQVFSPLDDRILVDVLPPETKSASGLIIIPDSVQSRQNRGVVVAVGPGRRNKKAKLRPMDVQMGDLIIYSEYAGTTIEVLGKEVLILREDEVLAIVNK